MPMHDDHRLFNTTQHASVLFVLWRERATCWHEGQTIANPRNEVQRYPYCKPAQNIRYCYFFLLLFSLNQRTHPLFVCVFYVICYFSIKWTFHRSRTPKKVGTRIAERKLKSDIIMSLPLSRRRTYLFYCEFKLRHHPTMFFSRVAISVVQRQASHAARRSSLASILTKTTPRVIRARHQAALATRLFSTNPQEVSVAPTDMFCRQCEQTQNHTGCVTTGVCGKSSETAAVQDALIEQVKAVSVWAVAARQAGIPVPEEVNAWTLQAAFSTLTNVNFSQDRICEYIREGAQHQATIQQLVGSSDLPAASVSSLNLSGLSNEELEGYGHTVGVLKRQAQMGDDDCFSLNEIGTYGLKG